MRMATALLLTLMAGIFVTNDQQTIIPEFVSAIVDVGFPVAIAVYLLVFQSKQIEKFRISLVKVEIGFQLILSKLDLTDDYKDAVKHIREGYDE